MSIYYNEHDPFAAEWLANLGRDGAIPKGFVDDRDIQKVVPADLEGYTQCHFFAGIGGWTEALRLAGWTVDRPVWTGSCPCQPFSVAGKRKGKADERHLWPYFFALIRECRPAIVFGEQVGGKDGLEWLDGVFADLEGIIYACGAADLPAACVGKPQKRQRLFWVAVSCATELRWRDQSERQHGGALHPANGGGADGLADATGDTGPEYVNHSGERPGSGSINSAVGGGSSWMEHTESDGRKQGRAQSSGRGVASGCGINGLGDSSGKGLAGREGITRDNEQERSSAERTGGDVGRVGNATGERRREARAVDESRRSTDVPCDSVPVVIACLDGKSRRVGRGVQPLAYGIPRTLGSGKPELRRLVSRARNNRVGRLRGYGNAIVPEVAAVFIRCVMETMGDDCGWRGNPGECGLGEGEAG